MIKNKVTEIAKKAKAASKAIANLDSKTKNKILTQIAAEFKRNSKTIIKANQIDMKKAKAARLDPAKMDRLMLDEKRINSLSDAILEVVKLDDPVGKITYDVERPNGLHIRRITTPIGVIAAIYEARPNVTSDIAALCLKSGNAAILRSGSECYNSSKVIADIYRSVLKKFNIDPNCVSYIESTDRAYVKELLKLENYIDVVIPRGGKDLIKAIMKSTKIPVFKHLDGNCHLFIDESADIEKARKITVNAKMRRTGICGAAESLLIDQKIAKKTLPLIVDDLNNLNCEVRGDEASRKIDKRIKKATEKDYYTEYLDKIISVKIVKNIDEAINHINHYGSSHTESIITENQKQVEKFFQNVNSAIVLHNASTQFADGGEFGLGAEVGISTGKLHARGPVGLEQLVIYKYIATANCGLRK